MTTESPRCRSTGLPGSISPVAPKTLAEELDQAGDVRDHQTRRHGAVAGTGFSTKDWVGESPAVPACRPLLAAC